MCICVFIHVCIYGICVHIHIFIHVYIFIYLVYIYMCVRGLIPVSDSEHVPVELDPSCYCLCGFL